MEAPPAGPAKPRLLMVARTRYALPLPESTERKFAAMREHLDLRALATAADGQARDDGVFHLVGRVPLLDGLLFYVLLPFRVRKLVRSHHPDAILFESPYTAAFSRFACGRARVVVEVHGDWRTATRLYGSRWRRMLAPLGDAIGSRALRRAHAVRTISPYTTALVRAVGVEPVAEFATFSDLGVFAELPVVPLPASPSAVFVGVLERYKNVDGLARAWRRAAPSVGGAKLTIIGRGSSRIVAEQLLKDLPSQVEWVEYLPPAEVARALDGATCLVLPSRSEGLGRVLIEAFLRGRPAVAAAVGGIRDVVQDGVNGILVGPGDAELTAALVRILTDRELAERLGRGALETARRWLTTPEQFAERIAEVVARARAG
jgi:glycosyltransferase involved in cell wall biosynthesis